MSPDTKFSVLAAALVIIKSHSMAVHHVPRVVFRLWQFLPVVSAVAVVFIILLANFAPSIITWIYHCFKWPGKVHKLVESISSLRKKKMYLCLKKTFKLIQRKLCLLIFPVLFTEHKMRRAEAQQNMDSSSEGLLLFLNRDVKDDSTILKIFVLMSALILGASAVAFISSVPLVTTGSVCLEQGNSSYSLFCYTHEGDPVDCANQTEATITCYALSLHIFGVACSAAWAIFKLAILITTAYVRVSEAFLQYTKNKKCVITCTRTVLFILTVIACVSIGADIIFTTLIYRGSMADLTKYVQYWYLPLWLCFGLIPITLNLEEHCKQTQYNTLSPDQFPPQNPLPQQGH